MGFIRDELAKLKNGDIDDQHDGDNNIPSGSTIGISPGKVMEDVHYMESHGVIDLSYLRFYSDDDLYNNHSFLLNNHNQNVNNNNGIHDNNGSNNNNYKNSVDGEESFVDIAIFEVPEQCTSRNCDLSKVLVIMIYSLSLTAQSLAILVSMALFVFLLLTMLAIRINWGTRADYEYERYGLLSDTTEEEEQQLSQTDDDNRSNTIDYHEEGDQEEDEDTESGEHNPSLRIEQATIA